MRLIDADAFKESILAQSNTGYESYLICDFVDESPTVSEQEIRDKAIDTFMIAIETLVKLHGAVVLSEIQEIAESLKESPELMEVE